ncbi:Microtubule-associated tumor suppressor candidate 2 [Halotydeus destructor]|nr:Microtubule-associated tumor suppressor candidate 2 [Halotydeus destructor]
MKAIQEKARVDIGLEMDKQRDLEARLAEKCAQLSARQAECDRLQERERELDACLASKCQELSAKGSECESLVEREAHLAARLSSTCQELSAAEAECDKVKEREKGLKIELSLKCEDLLAREIDLSRVRHREAELDKRLALVAEELSAKEAECAVLSERSKELEACLRQDKDKKVRTLQDKCRLLQCEVSSLNAVLELKDEKMRAANSQIMELEARTEELPGLRQSLGGLKQQLEQLVIAIENKNDQIRQLTDENMSLKQLQENVSKDRKRLSLRNEELEFALGQSYHESFADASQPSTPFREPHKVSDVNTPIRVPLRNPFNFLTGASESATRSARKTSSCSDLGQGQAVLRRPQSPSGSQERPSTGPSVGPVSLPAVTEGTSGPDDSPRSTPSSKKRPKNASSSRRKVDHQTVKLRREQPMTVTSGPLGPPRVGTPADAQDSKASPMPQSILDSGFDEAINGHEGC